MKRMKVNQAICKKCMNQVTEPCLSQHVSSIRSLFKDKTDEELIRVMGDIELVSIEIRRLRVQQVEGFCPCRRPEGPIRFVHPKCPYQMEHIVTQEEV
jgi:hypothetical protein